MAMQALAVVVGSVKLDRLRRRAYIVCINMLQPPHLRVNVAEHRVIGVAGEASLLARHQVVLKMGRRNETPIIHSETFAIIFHHMAGEAKLSRLGVLDVSTHTHAASQYW